MTFSAAKVRSPLATTAAPVLSVSLVTVVVVRCALAPISTSVVAVRVMVTVPPTPETTPPVVPLMLSPLLSAMADFCGRVVASTVMVGAVTCTCSPTRAVVMPVTLWVS